MYKVNLFSAHQMDHTQRVWWRIKVGDKNRDFVWIKTVDNFVICLYVPKLPSVSDFSLYYYTFYINCSSQGLGMSLVFLSGYGNYRLDNKSLVGRRIFIEKFDKSRIFQNYRRVKEN